ncbi:peroxisomal targeting signal 1 receptor-like [Stegodyphus dumicola]|uniref:peroxisomal targeting signal 1 receptor-like n=1 Tax=Stegodyphus dumicola TaxID=202533 RepID=UPI0015A988B0|nr:peroxisomal targeting signal 1 receptor-like [Stegodyphus dumicola]
MDVERTDNFLPVLNLTEDVEKLALYYSALRAYTADHERVLLSIQRRLKAGRKQIDLCSRESKAIELKLNAVELKITETVLLNQESETVISFLCTWDFEYFTPLTLEVFPPLTIGREAWQYLGSSQAKNEQDHAAIAALKRCLELDPDDLNALMSLAVSYTNETLQVQACETLVKWLLKNPKYTHLVKSNFVDDSWPVSSILPSNKREAAKEMFIEAARMNPTDPDPDVQNGLGVLFNLSSEYGKAVDCFKAALQVRPDDSLLWNRIGATLANSNRPGEAIEAYYHALELYPGFIRARFNLGISCINLGAAKEAAEHFLSALNLQNAGRGPQGKSSKAAMSSNIWSTLRIVMTLMKRMDLYQAVDNKDLDLLNKEFGMEV